MPRPRSRFWKSRSLARPALFQIRPVVTGGGFGRQLFGTSSFGGTS